MFFRPKKKAGTPLPETGKLPLGDRFWGLHGPNDVIYYSDDHTVRRMAHPAPGVSGYQTLPIPFRIKTVEELVAYLEEKCGLEREEPKPQPKPVTPSPAMPLCLHDPVRNKTTLLPSPSGRITVGRGKLCDLTFSDLSWQKYLAREQAMFIREEDRWYLMDQNSSNKTYVNGKALTPFLLMPLNPGDEIRFANQEPIFYGHAPLPEVLP